jgi:porin
MIQRMRRFVMVTPLLLAAFALADEPRSWAKDGLQSGEPTSNQSSQPASLQERDEDGLFTKLEKRGVSFSFQYTGEVFYGLRVNPNEETRIEGLVSLTLKLDTEKLGLWPGGELFVAGQNGHGKGFSVNPGGIAQPISNIDAPAFTEINEYGLRQNFWEGYLRLNLGRKDVNTIFCVNEFGLTLINPSYALIPTVPMPTFPATAVGAAIFAEPLNWLSFGLGFYDGGPQTGTLGIDTFLEGKEGYFMVFEPGWKPNFGEPAKYPGNYRLGLWYHSGDFDETGNSAQPRTYSGNYGLYLLFEQWIYRMEGKTPAEDRGLGAFVQFGWAPSDRNPVTRYLGAGFSFKGLVHSRVRDTLGIGASYTRLAGPEGNADLTNVELFYKASLISWLSLQPDIQYFDNPGNDQRNGWAFGLRCLVDF